MACDMEWKCYLIDNKLVSTRALIGAAVIKAKTQGRTSPAPLLIISHGRDLRHRPVFQHHEPRPRVREGQLKDKPVQVVRVSFHGALRNAQHPHAIL